MIISIKAVIKVKFCKQCQMKKQANQWKFNKPATRI